MTLECVRTENSARAQLGSLPVTSCGPGMQRSLVGARLELFAQNPDDTMAERKSQPVHDSEGWRRVHPHSDRIHAAAKQLEAMATAMAGMRNQ
jgi:hypothetical protein